MPGMMRSVKAKALGILQRRSVFLTVLAAGTRYFNNRRHANAVQPFGDFRAFQVPNQDVVALPGQITTAVPLGFLVYRQHGVDIADADDLFLAGTRRLFGSREFIRFPWSFAGPEIRISAPQLRGRCEELEQDAVIASRESVAKPVCTRQRIGD